jgi:hypothetical protein
MVLPLNGSVINADFTFVTAAIMEEKSHQNRPHVKIVSI